MFAGFSQSLTENRVWISNPIHDFAQEVSTYPCPNSTGGLTKPPLDLEHAWKVKIWCPCSYLVIAKCETWETQQMWWCQYQTQRKLLYILIFLSVFIHAIYGTHIKNVPNKTICHAKYSPHTCINKNLCILFLLMLVYSLCTIGVQNGISVKYQPYDSLIYWWIIRFWHWVIFIIAKCR